MPVLELHKESAMPCSAMQLFLWHESPSAFDSLLPPGEPVELLHHDGHIRDGAYVVLIVGRWPLRLRWELIHEGYIRGEQFCDTQVKGPFKSYHHIHRMIAKGGNQSILSDRITFEMPFGWLGGLVGKWFILPKLNKLFEYRHAVTLRLISS
jgi:uncharacterized protein